MEEAADIAAPDKKRKIGLARLEVSTSSVQSKTRRLDFVTTENSEIESTCDNESESASTSLDNVSASCCSSNESSEVAKMPEVEENEVAVDLYSATSTGDSFGCRERREATPSSVVQVKSGELESTERQQEPVPHGLLAAERLLLEDDLEEFFAAAEQNLQKQFMDKYNYDIVKDEPFKGRFEWAKIQQKP